MSETRKIVVNACHGGFGLSWAGMQRLAARKGLVASYFSLSPEIHEKVYGPGHALDPDDHFTHRVIGPRAITAYPEDREEYAQFKDAGDLARDDADLVAVVEELGDAASGPLSRLRVVEIPADAAWEIEEYDGREWVAETHRTWHPTY